MHRWSFAVLALASLAVSGCADEKPLPDDLAVPQEEPVGTPDPAWMNESFGWNAAAGAEGADAQVMGTNAASFEVPEGATRLTVETTWTCVSPACPLRVSLFPPGDVAGIEESVDRYVLGNGAQASAEGDGAFSFEVEGPQPGAWTVVARTVGASVGVEGTFSALVEGPGQESRAGQGPSASPAPSVRA